MAKLEKTKEYKALRDAMIEQARRRTPPDEEVDKVTLDMIETYMDEWRNLKGLQKDIDDRGVMVITATTGNLRVNESVGAKNKVSANMLKILSQLHFDEPAPDFGNEEDEEM
jgi:phage terminase small subunit